MLRTALKICTQLYLREQLSPATPPSCFMQDDMYPRIQNRAGRKIILKRGPLLLLVVQVLVKSQTFRGTVGGASQIRNRPLYKSRSSGRAASMALQMVFFKGGFRKPV